ncbi:MAG: helix-turn-helix domain-containing protein [Candidatus Paceibacterota bacterium]|jgi:transposase
MARFKDREKALALRIQGMSYSQIKKVMGLSKSTLSSWLRNYPLSKERIRELRGCNEQRIERYRETMREKRENKMKEIYQCQKKNLLPLKDCELFMMGLGLYWGEGTKCRQDGLSVSNTDPAIINFFIHWLDKFLGVPKGKVRIVLQLYSNMDVNKEIKFWSEEIKIPLLQFTKPYVKKNSSERINHKGSFGHGTCNARINDVSLAQKIFMSLKVISDKYGKG